MVFCGVSLAGAWCGIGFSLGFFELLRLSPLDLWSILVDLLFLVDLLRLGSSDHLNVKWSRDSEALPFQYSAPLQAVISPFRVIMVNDGDEALSLILCMHRFWFATLRYVKGL